MEAMAIILFSQQLHQPEAVPVAQMSKMVQMVDREAAAADLELLAKFVVLAQQIKVMTEATIFHKLESARQPEAVVQVL
jgi:hypothetical protein